MRFLLFLSVFLIGFVFGTEAQTIKNGGTVMTVTPGSHGVSNPVPNTTSYIFQAETSITISPSGTTPFIVSETGSTSGQYFLVRIVPPASYAELKEELDGSYYATIGSVIYFKYKEKYDGLLTYNIYDYTRTLVSSGTKSTVVGTNFLEINVSLVVPSLLADKYYFLEVINSNGDKQMLRFKNVVSDAN